MNPAQQERRFDVEGSPPVADAPAYNPAQPRDATTGLDPKDRTSKEQGRFQAAPALFMMLLALCGFILFISGLSAFQHYINDARNTSRWAIPSNFPFLTPSKVLRWDWWVLFGQLVVLVYAAVLTLRPAVVDSRPALVALFAAFAVLMSIEADRFNNVRIFVSGSTSQWRSASVVLAGAIVCAVSDFVLVMILGSLHQPYRS